MSRAYYSAPLNSFLSSDDNAIIGIITAAHGQNLLNTQTQAWSEQIKILKRALTELSVDGYILFEFLIPRMGRRSDVILIIGGIIFVIEFKVGADKFNYADRAQTAGYALDLKHFHAGSHDKYLVPVLICTKALDQSAAIEFNHEQVANVICTSGKKLAVILKQALGQQALLDINYSAWVDSSYKPTPTIVEAAQALYANHNVVDITRSEAGSQNIAETSSTLFKLIHQARLKKHKIICFVTGVPGAGKTLVGLNIANQHSKPDDDEYSVFLSGNGPLVAVLQEALALDLYQNQGKQPDSDSSSTLSKKDARRKVESFIQNIHRFRDHYLKDHAKPPEHVAIFDEAQRAWDMTQTSKFMRTKRNISDFKMSEPEFLMSVMDRHDDWAVIVALIGGGQEINVGEAGIEGWFDAVRQTFKDWLVYCSPNLLSGEYVRDGIDFKSIENFNKEPSLHLATSMRSFRAEKLSSFIHHLIAGDVEAAARTYSEIKNLFPIILTRDISKARDWIKQNTLANRRSGLLASSNGIRLKAEGVFVKNTIEPEKWFLAAGNDIRSSNFLEDAATEFDVQGLELDWALVAWDADLRFVNGKFQYWQFKGTNWQVRHKRESQRYLENAYRVLLTRAREGMVIFVPEGNNSDSTRLPSYYDGVYTYLLECGLTELLI